jgi:ABC-type polar amino acid transport system ATPase subunit
VDLSYKSLIVSVSAVIILGLTGCGESKVAQCNKLIDAINQGHTLVTSFEGNDAAAANKLATELEGITQQLNAVSLKDPKLVEYRQRFSGVYQELAKAFRTTGTALKTASDAKPTQDGVERVQKAKEEVKAAGKVAEESAKKADQLAGEINTYCGSSNS